MYLRLVNVVVVVVGGRWSVLLFGFGVCILLCIVALRDQIDDCIAWNSEIR